MLSWGNRLVAAIGAALALVLTLGAASAWAGRITVHGGPPAGIVKPIGGLTTSAPITTGAPTIAPAQEFQTGSSGPGSSPPTCSQCRPPLLYWGGPVMHAVTTHVIAWAPSGYPFPSGYVSGYETFLSDLQLDLGQGTNISSVAAEYVDANGSALSSLTNDTVINDSNAYPTSGGCTVSGAAVCLTEPQLVNEVGSIIAGDSLSFDLSQSYVVLLPPGVDSCVDSTNSECENQAFCGYHDTISEGTAETTFTLLPYTDSTFSNAKGYCYDGLGPSSVSPYLMALDSVGAHELLESATDPVVGTGYLDSAGYEIGDECAWYYGSTSTATGGGAYNQLLNGDQYLIQDMWSDQDNNCEPGDVSVAKATITSSPNPTTSAPTSFSASLTGASATGATYTWSYEDPNGNLSENVASGANPQITLSTLGTYTVWVQVSDNAGGTVIGVTDVTVSAVPTAAFGYTTQTAVPATGSAVSFTSTSTAASGQSITSWSWAFGDGTTGSGSSVSHTYTSPGPYTVTLTVKETDGGTAQASHTITVATPPTAAFTAGTNPTAGTSLAFSSTGTAAGAGSITGYSWSFGDGGTSTAANPSHTYAIGGNHIVTLTVTQTDGLTASVQHTIDVTTPPPTAAFSDSFQTAVPATGSPVSFTSTSSAFTGESITGSAWDFGDGGSSTATNPSHTYTTAGTYTVTLTVTQTTGETAQISHMITVSDPPTAAFTWGANPTAGTSLAFSSSGTTAGSDSITTYQWNFGDGDTSGAANPSNTYATAGSYTVTLTVTQADGLTTSVSHTLTVAAAQSSGGTSGATTPGGTTGSSGSTGSAPTNARATATLWLTHVLAATRGSGRITTLLKQHGTRTVVSAPSFSGHVTITWYATVKRHRVVVARGSASVAAGVRAHIVIKLTRAGRALLAKSRIVRITASGIYKFGSSSVTASRKLTLKRR